MLSRLAKALRLLCLLILMVGAVYMALVHHTYAISGCFALAALLLLLGSILKKPIQKRIIYEDATISTFDRRGEANETDP